MAEAGAGTGHVLVSYPLYYRESRLGALDLYLDQAKDLEHLDDRDAATARTVAGIAAGPSGPGPALRRSSLTSIASALSTRRTAGPSATRSYAGEPVFVCEDLHRADDAPMLALRVERAFVEPVRVGDVELTLTASVGVAYAGPGEEILQQLLIKAHVAAFERKISAASHSGRVVDLRDDMGALFRPALGSESVRAT